MKANTKLKQDPSPKPPDPVDETSEESVPASDPPSWTPGTGVKKSAAKTSPAKADAKKEGCANSFLMQKRGELDEACGEGEPDPKEEYVQPDKEREAGGEG